MTGEARFISEEEYTFQPRGRARFKVATFLSVWLCIWVATEVLVLSILGNGIWSLLTGAPLMNLHAPIRMGVVAGTGAFLLVWLSLWTIGGLAATYTLLHLLWAEDRLVVGSDALLILHRLGPFKYHRRLKLDEIQRIFVQSADTKLMALLKDNLIQLTSLGTPDERQEAAKRLRTRLGLPDKDSLQEIAGLPDEWQAVTGPSGESLLVPNLQERRKQATAVAVITGIAWTLWMPFVLKLQSDSNLLPIILMLTVVAVWLTRRTLWMLRGRNEWRIARGKLVYQRRINNKVKGLYESTALELIESSDSDGDPEYYLYAIELARPSSARAHKLDKKIKITFAPKDADEPRCMGHWLSQQAGIPLHDRIRSEAEKQAEMDCAIDQLAKCGTVGRVAVRLIERARAHDMRDFD